MIFLKSRIRETQNLLTNADRSTDTERKLFGGDMDGRMEVRTYGAGGGGVTCHARALKLRMKLWRYKNFTKKIEVIGVDFEQFKVILLIKNPKIQNNLSNRVKIMLSLIKMWARTFA